MKHLFNNTDLKKSLDIFKERYRAYDFVQSMRKFCTGRSKSVTNDDAKKSVDAGQRAIANLNPLKGVERYAGTHLHFNHDMEQPASDDQQQHGLTKHNKRKRMRGSRGGRNVKQKRCTSKVDEEESAFDSTLGNETTTTPVAPSTTIGNHLIGIFLNNAAKDISAGDDGFHTQEDTQPNISPGSILKSTGDSLDSKTKSQRNRIKRKMKKLLTRTITSPVVNKKEDCDVKASVYDPPSILLPMGSRPELDCGRNHHLNRPYPVSPVVSN